MHTLQIFIWFLRLSLYGAVVLVPLALLAVVAIVILIRSTPIERWKYWLLTPLPLLWIFVGLWGGLFWVDWHKTPFVPNPQWIGLVVTLAVGVYVAGAIALIVYLRGIRLFVTLFAVLNLYFMLAMAALSSMAISGTWI
jgi:hypothetical protein